MDNREKDLREAASVLIKELLGLKQGERFLIYVDRGSDYGIVKVIQEGAQQIGVSAELFELSAKLELPDLAIELERKVENGHFDVICELSEQYFYQTSAWKKAAQSGSRIYSLAGMDTDAFIRCIGKVNHNSMFKFGTALRDVLMKAQSVQILTGKGTRIKFQMKLNLPLRLILKLKRKEGPWVWYPSGIFTRKLRATFMGGQFSFQGITETIEGVVVVDGYLWPPKEIGYLDTPITMKIKKGRVIKIDGCPSKTKILNRWFGQQPMEIQHFCIGFNPGARLSGKITEAERVFGAISIGIGRYPFHIDGVIKSPSILVNNEYIEQEGSFKHKELSALERSLVQNNASFT